MLGGVEASERQVRSFCRQHPAALAAAMGVTLLSWLGMIAEYWLALWALGIRLSPVEAIVALTAARIAFLAALPAGLGALEASQVLVLGAMGVNPAAGLSLSLLIRLRDTGAGRGRASGGACAWQDRAGGLPDRADLCYSCAHFLRPRAGPRPDALPDYAADHPLSFFGQGDN